MGKEQGSQILANLDSNFSSGILDCRQNTIFFFFPCKGSEILKNLPKVIELVCNHFSNLWLLNKALQNLVA